MADPLSSAEIVRRFRAVEAHVRSHPELFVVDVPYAAGSGTTEADLARLESEIGVSLPQPLRGALLELAGTRWHYHLRKELQEEWDADNGIRGGAEWLSVDAMRRVAGRLSRATEELGATILPFAADVAGAAAWLGVAAVDDDMDAVQAQHDGDVERWDLALFLDDWSRGGFRIHYRWEDQPESMVEHLAEALGLPADDEGLEDG